MCPEKCIFAKKNHLETPWNLYNLELMIINEPFPNALRYFHSFCHSHWDIREYFMSVANRFSDNKKASTNNFATSQQTL